MKLISVILPLPIIAEICTVPYGVLIASPVYVPSLYNEFWLELEVLGALVAELADPAVVFDELVAGGLVVWGPATRCGVTCLFV